MRNTFFICLVLMGMSVVGSVQAQTGAIDQVAASKALKTQATAMGKAFVEKDYKTFSHYAYPKLLTMMGGEAKMAEVLTQTMDQMKSQGVIFKGFTLGEPSKAVKAGNGLQATIAQHLQMQVPNGKVTTTSTLIAFSADNGRNWTFMDTNNKDIATIHKMLPELSPSITIPPPVAPVQTAN